jgi:LPXTG-motif cell wall-anchored protein
VVVQLKQAPVQAVKPTGEDVEIAQVVTAPPAEALVATNDTQLPKTASPMPLIGLLGLLSLGAAFTLKFARTRA